MRVSKCVKADPQSQAGARPAPFHREAIRPPWRSVQPPEDQSILRHLSDTKSEALFLQFLAVRSKVRNEKAGEGNRAAAVLRFWCFDPDSRFCLLEGLFDAEPGSL